MSEKSLWGWLKPRLPKGHWDRVESETTSPGIPDVHGIIRYPEKVIRTQTVWLELKFARNLKAQIPFKRGGLRDSQKRWLQDYREFGGQAWIVAQVGNSILFIHPFFIADFNRMTSVELVVKSSLVLNTRTEMKPDSAAPLIEALLLRPS